MYNLQLMKIIILKERYIDEIKEEFNTAFPYLKIDFKFDANLPNRARSKVSMGKLKLGDISMDSQEGILSINENNSIRQVAQKFTDNFGLKTNFFRKSGNLWLEIKATGD